MTSYIDNIGSHTRVQTIATDGHINTDSPINTVTETVNDHPTLLCSATRQSPPYQLVNVGHIPHDEINELPSYSADKAVEEQQWLQTTHPTSGGAVTADSSCCANCVEPPRPKQWGPDLPFLGHAGHADPLDG